MGTAGSMRFCGRQARNGGPSAPNAKRVYRVMKVHGLLLQRHSGKAGERRHDGRVAVDTRNTRWCSDGFEIGCDNGEKVRVAFSLDCCDREAMGFVATTAGISAENVRDLMTATMKRDYVRVPEKPNARAVLNQLPSWLHHYSSVHLHRDPGYPAPHEYIVQSTSKELFGK